jgi:hypothetical protein
LSRIEYRISYQILKDGEPAGRVWRHICHTYTQVFKYVKHMSQESARCRRQFGIVRIDYRPVGRWTEWPGDLEDLPKEAP